VSGLLLLNILFDDDHFTKDTRTWGKPTFRTFQRWQQAPHCLLFAIGFSTPLGNGRSRHSYCGLRVATIPKVPFHDLDRMYPLSSWLIMFVAMMMKAGLAVQRKIQCERASSSTWGALEKSIFRCGLQLPKGTPDDQRCWPGGTLCCPKIHAGARKQPWFVDIVSWPEEFWWILSVPSIYEPLVLHDLTRVTKSHQ
jgi:hypothetical protein